eukprot:GEMP01015902.1.p1 GENE.GEMP01015902.1~~GEMP01015902.1.p1  ORF type:complete len:273 (-),score=49.67 GEMP01015902.1:1962-2780(-)
MVATQVIRRECDAYNLEVVRSRDQVRKAASRHEHEEAKIGAIHLHRNVLRDAQYKLETAEQRRELAQHWKDVVAENRDRKKVVAPVADYERGTGILPWDGQRRVLTSQQRKTEQDKYRTILDTQVTHLKDDKRRFLRKADEISMKTHAGEVSFDSSFHRWEDNPAMRTALNKWYVTNTRPHTAATASDRPRSYGRFLGRPGIDLPGWHTARSPTGFFHPQKNCWSAPDGTDVIFSPKSASFAPPSPKKDCSVGRLVESSHVESPKKSHGGCW